ncbi:hypothetical protein [Streptomyces sp. CB03238]|uniref:hypothetical protein n=1 Tax=Streptomyces sp. CB03238 TaxID=1907777 RepID=UPI0015C42974|nr:hypothetical protein [Streptomyces sp. CB03238]
MGPWGDDYEAETEAEAARGRSCALLALALPAIAFAAAFIAAGVAGIGLFAWLVAALTP